MPDPTPLVLDTNVFVSGVLSPHGPPGRLVDLALRGDVRLVVDDRTLLELSEVLARVSFGLAPGDVREFVGFVARTALHLSPRTLRLALPDPDDAPFIELAAEARVPLVTGNDSHFREAADRLAITLLSPREALEMMAGE